MDKIASYKDDAPTFPTFITYGTLWLMEMSLPTNFPTSVFYWLQYHPIAATFCVLIILHKVYTWLFPDPMVKLPVAPGGNWFGGHALIVIEWVTQATSRISYCLIGAFSLALVAPPPFTRNMSKSWVGMYVYEGFILCVKYPGLCSSACLSDSDPSFL